MSSKGSNFLPVAFYIVKIWRRLRDKGKRKRGDELFNVIEQRRYVLRKTKQNAHICDVVSYRRVPSDRVSISLMA